MRQSEFFRLHLRLVAAIAVLSATGLILARAGSPRLEPVQRLAAGLAGGLSLASGGRAAAKTAIFAAPSLELRDLAQRF
jgi:hypothetical protein